MFKINLYQLFFFLLFLNKIVLSVIIPAAGNTAVSVQAQATFPAGDNTNTMLGFGAFTNGFILSDNTTTCSFSSFFPVQGSIEMRGGTIWITRDLEFAQTSTFVSVGTFYGATPSGQFAVFFPALNGALTLPSGTPGVNGSNNILNLIATQALTNVVNSVDWSFDSKYISAVQSGGGTNVFVLSFINPTLSTVASANAGGTQQTIRWHPTQDFLAVGDDNLRTYSFDRVGNTLTQLDSQGVGGAVAAVAWNPSGTIIASGSTGQVTIVSVNQTTGVLTSLDNINTIKNVQQNAIDWTFDGTYIAVGDNAAPQLNILFFNSVSNTITVTQSASPGTVSALEWSPIDDYLAIGISGGTDNIRIFQFVPATGALTDLVASHVGETANVLGADWSPDGNNVTFSLATSSGTELRTYSFNRSTNVLTLTGAVDSASNVNETRWSDNSLYISTGDSADNVKVYGTAGTTTGPLTFNSTKAVLNSDIILTTSALFQGTCLVDGNGHTFDITSAPSFKIDTGASLLLKNMTLRGISGNRVNFADSAGLLRLQDVTWIQNGNFSLTTGALEIDNSVLITGTSSTFVYSTAQTSTITSNSILTFDAGMTFSYVSPTTSRNLLQMIDLSSQLYLLNTTLFSTSTGLQFTKGTLVVDGPCTILSSATVQNQGIMFGDGASSANNVTIKVLPESGLQVNSGFLVYNNV